MRVRTNHVPNLAPPMTEDGLAALRERNAARTKTAIADLGPKWVGWLPAHERTASLPANVAPINQQRKSR